MAIREYPIGMPSVNRFTVAARALSQLRYTSDWNGPFAGERRKIMDITKQKGGATNVTKPEVRELTVDELDTVEGGLTAVFQSGGLFCVWVYNRRSFRDHRHQYVVRPQLLGTRASHVLSGP